MYTTKGILEIDFWQCLVTFQMHGFSNVKSTSPTPPEFFFQFLEISYTIPENFLENFRYIFQTLFSQKIFQ